MISSISPSPRKGKRFRVIYTDKNGEEKAYNFGQPDANTYVDGASEETRNNYWKRHMGNPREKKLIENLTPSPAVFAGYILWGNSRNIQTNIKNLNRLL